MFLADILENNMSYFVKLIRSHYVNLFLIYLLSIIPLIVSLCFFFDIFYMSKYYYFPRSVILLIIPFFIYIILFSYKAVSKYMDKLKRENYNISQKGLS